MRKGYPSAVVLLHLDGVSGICGKLRLWVFACCAFFSMDCVDAVMIADEVMKEVFLNVLMVIRDPLDSNVL